MLYASDFTRQGLHQFLRREYALEAIEISDIPGGSACLFLAVCGDGRRLVVKEYQRGFDARGVRHEAGLCGFLREKGLPTARFVHTRGGETACEHRGRPVTVQEFIEGETPENHGAAPWLLEASARLLGEIHR
ncbi:MAG: phosphotransferase, partial [Oscillospiraceae bacterium]|nr:phosphotransferase [Oscillospiraceae bacterium]